MISSETKKPLMNRLPPELVLMVASLLDLPSYLTLASSSNALAKLLLSKPQWTTIFARTKMNGRRMENVHSLKRLRIIKAEMTAELNQLIAISRIMKDPDSSFLLSLLDFICERFPVIKQEEGNDFDFSEISLTCPCKETHVVSPFGFSLLEQVETSLRGPRSNPLQKLVAVEGAEDPDYTLDHLKNLATRASRQNQPVKSVMLGEIVTSVDNEAWLELLGHCNSWKIRQIQMKPDKSLWERLAGVACRGSIGTLRTTTKTVAAGVRMDHTEAVKLITEEFLVFDHVENIVVIA